MRSPIREAPPQHALSCHLPKPAAKASTVERVSPRSLRGEPGLQSSAQSLRHPAPARFPGQWFQIESGLHYNWHRHYDPSIGRYTQPDPLRFVDGPSVYAYAGNSPIMYIDEDGRVAWFVPVLIGAAVGGGIDLGIELWRHDGDFDCVNWRNVAVGTAIGALTGAGGVVARFAILGREIKFGRNLRIAPFGNRTGHPIGRFPHYHRRGAPDPVTGQTRPGQGIGRHRPWETSPVDKSFWDLF
jgi:RHS repeat-associated protein